jgi:hypothetical protein
MRDWVPLLRYANTFESVCFQGQLCISCMYVQRTVYNLPSLVRQLTVPVPGRSAESTPCPSLICTLGISLRPPSFSASSWYSACSAASGERGTLRAEMERWRVRAIPAESDGASVKCGGCMCPRDVEYRAVIPWIRGTRTICDRVQRYTYGERGCHEKGGDAKDEGDLE